MFRRLSNDHILQRRSISFEEDVSTSKRMFQLNSRNVSYLYKIRLNPINNYLIRKIINILTINFMKQDQSSFHC